MNGKIVDFPAERFVPDHPARPYWEATNENGTWVLYIVNGYSGDYRRIATFVDKEAVEAFFAHRARGG